MKDNYTLRVLLSCLADLFVIITSGAAAVAVPETQLVIFICGAQFVILLGPKVKYTFKGTGDGKRCVYLMSISMMYVQSMFLAMYVHDFMSSNTRSLFWGRLPVFFTVVALFVSWICLLLPEIHEMYLDNFESSDLNAMYAVDQEFEVLSQ